MNDQVLISWDREDLTYMTKKLKKEQAKVGPQIFYVKNPFVGLNIQDNQIMFKTRERDKSVRYFIKI